ncbi:MAG: murein hydrolase activator EnvC family protein, partial [Syntrophothermus sp.]
MTDVRVAAIRWVVALVIGALFSLPLPAVTRAEKSAPPPEAPKDPLAEMQDINMQIYSTQIKITRKKKEEQKVLAALERTEQELDQTRDRLARIERDLQTSIRQVAEAERRLAEAEADLTVANGEMMEVQKHFSDRVRAIYEMGAFNYVELLFTAEDFTDFMIRLELLQRILESDVQLFQRVKAEKNVVEAEKSKIEQRKAELERYRARMASLRGDTVNAVATMEQLQAQREKQLSAIQNERKMYEAALAEEEETSRQLETWLQRQGGGRQEGAPPSTGSFLWPVTGFKMTSGFEWRVHPIFRVRSFHTGFDLAVPYGTPIQAAAGGRVIFVGWKGGYGKTVIIDHGGGVT